MIKSTAVNSQTLAMLLGAVITSAILLVSAL